MKMSGWPASRFFLGSILAVASVLGLIISKWLDDDDSINYEMATVIQRSLTDERGYPTPETNKAPKWMAHSDIARWESLSKIFPGLTVQKTDVGFRKIKENPSFQNWTFVAQEVQEAGHPWCSLYRDEFTCVGERYKELLRETPLYDHAFDLNAFPPNSRIYIEGNSWMAELVYTTICNTEDVKDVWFLPTLQVNGNSVFVKTKTTNVQLLLIDNHWLQMDPITAKGLLQSMDFDPDVIVWGEVNRQECRYASLSAARCTRDKMKHKEIFTKEFPGAKYFSYPGRHLPANCRADWSNCANGSSVGHTCLPGPANTFAQDLVAAILSGESSLKF